MNNKHYGLRVFRQFIITAGFLPGMWIHLGISPEDQVTYVIIDVIAAYISQIAVQSQEEISAFAKFMYDISGFATTFIAALTAYSTGKGWTLLCLALAFIGGLTFSNTLQVGYITINAVGIWLFIIVWIFITPFLPVNEDSLFAS